MPWTARCDEPVDLPDGSKLRSLRAAIQHLVRAVPSAERNHPAVLTAATILTQAAEGSPAWVVFARIATLKAIHRHKERVFNPDRKETHWGKRKIKRDQ